MNRTPSHSTSPVSTLTPPKIEVVLDALEVSENETKHGDALARAESLDGTTCSFEYSNDSNAA